MLQFHKDISRYLTQQFLNMKSSELIILKGEEGLGKSEVISDFCNKIKQFTNIIRVNPKYKYPFSLAPIIEALKKVDINDYDEIDKILARHLSLAKSPNEQPNSIGESLSLDGNGLLYSEEICAFISRVCRRNEKTVIVLEKTEKYADEFFLFIQDLLQYFLSSCQKVLFICEINANCLFENDALKRWTYYLGGVAKDIIKFNSLSEYDMRTIFFENLSPNRINIDIVNKIVNASFGNPYMLKLIVSGLKFEGIIKSKESIWYCKDFSKVHLKKTVEEFILSRYNRLNHTLKEILRKSSIVGFEINELFLKKPFNVFPADELLSQIESISRLIIKNEKNYSFDNLMTFETIKDLLTSDESYLWHSIIAEFLEKGYNHERQLFIQKYNIDEITLVRNIAIHYECIDNYRKAVDYSFILINLYFSINDYSNAKKITAKNMNLAQMIDIEIEKLQLLEINYAKCCEFLCEYEEAIRCYTEMLENSSYYAKNKQEISYLIARCYYLIGSPHESLEILKSLLCSFKEECNQVRIEVKALSLIASVYDWYCNPTEAIKYFSLALEKCKQDPSMEFEYYSICRKANMIYLDIELSFDIMESAAIYFNNNGYIKEYAKVIHNIGTDKILNKEFKIANMYLLKCRSIFESFCSKDTHYVTNSLGILECAYNNNYYKALEHFDSSFKQSIEIFCKLAIILNKASCYRKLQDFKKCLQMIEEASSILNLNTDRNDLQLQKRNLLMNFGFYYKNIGDYNKAYSNFYDSFYCVDYSNIKSYATSLIAKELKDIGENLHKEIPNIIYDYAQSTNVTTMLFYELDMYLCNIMFWD